MLKRKNYLVFHEGDTSSDSSSSESESESESDEEIEEENQQEEATKTNPKDKRTSDESNESEDDESDDNDDDDDDDGESDDDVENGNGTGGNTTYLVDAQQALVWQGPIRCRLCGVLCLTPSTRDAHIQSAKHRKRLKAHRLSRRVNGTKQSLDRNEQDDDDVMELASGCYGPSRKFKRAASLSHAGSDKFEQMETHTERAQRIIRETENRQLKTPKEVHFVLKEDKKRKKTKTKEILPVAVNHEGGKSKNKNKNKNRIVAKDKKDSNKDVEKQLDTNRNEKQRHEDKKCDDYRIPDPNLGQTDMKTSSKHALSGRKRQQLRKKRKLARLMAAANNDTSDKKKSSATTAS